MSMEGVLPPRAGKCPAEPRRSVGVVRAEAGDLGQLVALLSVDVLALGPHALIALVPLDDLLDRAVGAQLPTFEVQPALAIASQVSFRVRHEEQRRAVAQQLL